MKTLKHALLLIAAGCLLWGGCTSSRVAQEPEAAPKSIEEDLVEKSIAARGGLENIKAIESLQWNGTVEMMGMSMPLTVYVKRPGKMRSEVEVTSMNMEVVSGYDGETAWTVNPAMGGAQKLSDEQAQLTQDMADMDGVLVGYQEKGYTLEYLGEEDVRGKNTHKLRIVRPERPEAIMYLDAETFLEVKSEGEGINPQTGGTAQMATYMTDYREVNGMMIPFAFEVVMGGQLFQQIVLKSAKTNVELDDGLFAFPGQ